MNPRIQFVDRIRQALATDARTAGTTVGALTLWQCYDIAYEVSQLYPWAGGADIADALHEIRTDTVRVDA